ncbi:hypothetical protein [Haloarchaeobius sp. TZWSO28]|uniref:hypothetical protein n=1 Tax=Haloarchaeobius sp. TZWSO28 TaxID=3446119 RepID=UPI003EBB75D3
MITSEQYVLNVVQNPKLLEIAYRAIQAGNTKEEDIVAQTGLESDDEGSGTFDQATDGLLTFGLAQKSEYKYIPEPLAFDTGDWGLDFRMTMLHNIAEEATEPDWGKQSAVVLNYEWLLNNKQYFSGTSSELRDKIDRWHQEQGYEPRNKNGERMKLNPEKFNHWRNQAEYLGLIHPTKGQSSTYTVAPDPKLVEASVRAACEQEGDGDGIEAKKYVDWLKHNLLRVPLTPEGAFTKPFASTMYRLAKTDRISFVKRGDQTQVGFEGVAIGSNDGISKSSNYITVNA